MYKPPTDAQLRDVKPGELYFFVYKSPDIIWPWTVFVRRRMGTGPSYNDMTIDNTCAVTRKGAIRAGRRIIARTQRLESNPTEVYRAETNG